MSETTNKKAEATQIAANVRISAGGTIEITVEEYTRLKDVETRFEIMKREMLKASYCPIHHQIILGIENECAQKQEIDVLSFMKKEHGEDKQ